MLVVPYRDLHPEGAISTGLDGITQYLVARTIGP